MYFLLAASWWDRNSGALTFAGVVIAVFFGIVGIFLYLLQRDKKTFDWQLLTNETIVSPSFEAPNEVKVLWNDVELKHPRLVTVRLINTGKREIRPDDFDGDVVVSVGLGFDVKSAYPIRTRGGMRHRPVCRPEADGCFVTPILYNRGDWSDIQLLVDRHEPVSVPPYVAEALRQSGTYEEDRSDPDVAVDAVVAGQTRPGKKIEAAKEPIRDWRYWVLLTLLLALLAAFSILLFQQLRS